MINGVLPSFWLKVRKEYIFDNFEEMVAYLHSYPVDGAHEVTADYAATLDAMSQIVDEIAAKLADTPICAATPDYDNRKPATLVRLMAVLLLAENKRGVSRGDVLLTLVAYMMAIRAEIPLLWWSRLWTIAVSCIRGRAIDKLGFQWADVTDAGSFSVPMFICRLVTLSFRAADKACACHYENRGLMTVAANSNVARLYAVNLATVARGGYESLFENPVQTEVMVPAADVKSSRESFETLFAESRFALKALAQFKPSPERKLRDYEPGDTFVVKVTYRSGIKFVGETVDPAYNRLSGKILIKWTWGIRPDDDRLRNAFGEGRLILVRRADPQSDYAFDAEPALEEFYRQFAAEFADKTVMAVYERDIAEGALWVTEDGIRVIIHDTKISELDSAGTEAYDEAVESLTPIPVRFYKNAPDLKKDKFKVFAQPEFDGDGSDDIDRHPFTTAEADMNFVSEFMAEADYAARDFDAAGADSVEVDNRAVDTLARLLYARPAAAALAPVDALSLNVATAMLCHMAGRSLTFGLLCHRLETLDRLVAFCHNREVRPLSHPAELDDIAEVRQSEAVVECLRRYADPTTTDPAAGDASGAADLTGRISTLVSASNSLRGIIGELELNNIKKAIATSLHVADEFEPITGDRTFYGSESVSLEFKTTVVFPPENRRRYAGTDADPDLQKWAILKCVCGYLNSRSGGELLIGVNDGGYASGIDNDIEALFERRLIASADVDHYRLYVQNIIDHAFREYGASTLSTDITSLNIDYQPETNAEGVTILRIHVRPYSYGVVAFATDLNRPADYAESYVRRDGRTLKLTPALRAEVERYKLEAPTSASRGVINVSRAIDEKLVVVLRGYTSRSGKRDRTIEPYKVWKKRGIVYGYDLDSRQARLFKVARAASGVDLTDRHWTSRRSRADIDIDDFGMLLQRDSAFDVELSLTDYGLCLLNELTPTAVVTPARGDTRYPWRYRSRVSSPVGVARFVIGLPDDVKVSEGEPVREMVREMARSVMAE